MVQKLRKFFSPIIILGVFLYFFYTLYVNREYIVNNEWNLVPWNVSLLIVSVMLIYPLNVLAWHYLTKLFGAEISLKSNYSIWIISNSARYLPGTVWQHASKFMMLHANNVTKKKAATIVISEVVAIVLVGVSLTIFVVPYSDIYSFWMYPELWFRVLAIIPIAGLIVLYFTNIYALIIRTVRKLAPKFSKLPDTITFAQRNIFVVITFIGLQFVVSGLALFALTSISSTVPDYLILRYVYIFTFAWFVGFFTLISPGGLGTFDLVAVTLLSTSIPISIATVVVLLFRVTVLFSEAIYLSIALIITRHKDNSVSGISL